MTEWSMELGSGYLLQVSGRGKDNTDSIGLNSPVAASQGQSHVLQQEGERVWVAVVQRHSVSGVKSAAVSVSLKLNFKHIFGCKCSASVYGKMLFESF